MTDQLHARLDAAFTTLHTAYERHDDNSRISFARTNFISVATTIIRGNDLELLSEVKGNVDRLGDLMYRLSYPRSEQGRWAMLAAVAEAAHKMVTAEPAPARPAEPGWAGDVLDHDRV